MHIRRRVLLEVCIASVDDAVNAVAAGADRLELNTALALGGLTPSAGLLHEVRRAVAVPIITMARPRPGGFAYGAADFHVLLRDVESSLADGADGVAFGVLHPDGTLDLDRCREVVRLVGDRTAVFHRAFDVAADPWTALEQLIDLGVARILSSGRQPTAAAGVHFLAELIHRAAGRIEIVPGGGVNPSNAAALIAATACDQVHASCKTRRPDPTGQRGPVSFDPDYEATDPDLVRRLRAALDAE